VVWPTATNALPADAPVPAFAFAGAAEAFAAGVPVAEALSEPLPLSPQAASKAPAKKSPGIAIFLLGISCPSVWVSPAFTDGPRGRFTTFAN
jgi:hypothetical protein